ncbi:MAG: Kelch repeat-containing protein [Chitinophagaceae bacterium]
MKHLKNLVLVATSFALIGVACKSTTTEETTTVGNWVKRSAFDGNGRAGAVSFVIGNTAYVGTGFDGTIRYNDFWAYNPTTDTWSQVALMPGTKRNSGIAFTANGNGYVATGYDGINKLQDNWEYNPGANTWTQKAGLPDPANGVVGSGARYGAVGFGIGAKGYICSGYTGSHTKDLWEFDPANGAMGTWTQKASMNTSDKRRDATVMVYNNEAYIVSGTNNGTVVTEMAKYSPSTDKWTKLRDIANLSSESYDDTYTSIVRGSAVAFVIDKKGYLATGQNGSNTSTVWEYDFATDAWTSKTTFERSTRNAAVGFSVAGKGFVGLGTNSTYYFDNLDEFKPNESYNAND